MANLLKSGINKTVTSKSITANCAEDMNIDTKVGENVAFISVRNVSEKLNIHPKARKRRVSDQKPKYASNNVEVAVPFSENDSCKNTLEEKSSSIPPLSAVVTNTSRIPSSSNVKSGDNIMHGTPVMSHLQYSTVLKRQKSRQKKSSSRLSAKDNGNVSPGEKSKPYSGLKKARSPSGDCDVELNAVKLAKVMGFDKPHEKIAVKASGSDKEEELTKHVSPVEIIQQIIAYRKSCKCSCLADLNIQEVASHCMEITLLDRPSRDFFIMGLLRCGAVTLKESCQNNSRIRNRFSYRLMNTRICHCCFLTVNNIGGKYLKNLKKHYAKHGVTSRLHGNLGRKPYHAISSSDTTDVVDFVNRYASVHGVPAARRPKNPKTKHILRLPFSHNVTLVHKKYKEFNDQSGKRAVALTSFRKIWSHHLPHIKLTIKDTISSVRHPPPSIDPQDPGPDIDADHSTLKQMLQSKRTNQSLESVIHTSDLRTPFSQKLPVNLPYDYSSVDLPHNQMTSLSMYLNDGNDHDALQYGNIFSHSSMVMPHPFQTISNNSISPESIYTSSKTAATQVSTSSILQQSFPVSMNSPFKHMADAFNSSPDKHLLLLSPNSALDVSSSQLPIVQYNHKTAVPVFTHTSLIANAGSDIHQQISSPIESGMTNLSQQINMSLI